MFFRRHIIATFLTLFQLLILCSESEHKTKVVTKTKVGTNEPYEGRRSTSVRSNNTGNFINPSKQTGIKPFCVLYGLEKCGNLD